MAVTRNSIILSALFIAESLVITSQFRDQIEPYYPLGYDQTSYLMLTYDILGAFFSIGWVAFFSQFGLVATGATFPLQGVFLALIGGDAQSVSLFFVVVH